MAASLPSLVEKPVDREVGIVQGAEVKVHVNGLDGDGMSAVAILGWMGKGVEKKGA